MIPPDIIRSWLFVPGHRQSMVEKSLLLSADAVIFDLEDAVPPDEKQAARDILTAILSESPRNKDPFIFVRVHPSSHSEHARDLAAVVRRRLTGLVLPKVGTADAITRLEDDVSLRESIAGRPNQLIRIVPMIESASGLVNAQEIVESSDRVFGLMFGAEDYALDVGIPVSAGSDAFGLAHARATMAVVAASRGVHSIDRVFIDYRDDEGLERDALASRSMGFTGKSVIHPKQIDIVNSTFRPTKAEAEEAQRVVDAFENSDGGVVSVDGRMVDWPVLERAKRVVEEARH